MNKMKGSQILVLALLSFTLSLLPNSDGYCFSDGTNYQALHTCINMDSEELEAIVNLYLDSESVVQYLLLANNSIAQIGNSFFTSSWSDRLLELTISKCQLEYIAIGTFTELKKLNYLAITDNNLKAFDGVVLEGLDILKTLHLKGNNLESIENICSAATNLEEFVIERNYGEIKTITANVFKDCSNIQRLTITDAGIINIDSGFATYLTNLYTLNLTANNLNNLRFLESDESLAITSLDVSYNKITEVDAELLRVSLNKLETFNLTANEIYVFMKDANVGFSHSLQELYLKSNKISIINKDFFKYFSSSLRTLDIDYNPIENIESDVFQYIPNVKTLQLKNSLRKWNHLKQGMFNHLQNLYELDLSDVNIVSIELDTFKDMESLNNLYLHNNNITELHNGTFNGLNNLNVLKLNNNPISIVEPGAFFGLKYIRNFYPKTFLNIKRIQSRQFEGLSYNYLYDLDISNMKIESLDELAFKGLFGLNSLLLNNNKITTLVEDTFIGLDNLYLLNISSNNLATINKNAFSKLGKLTSLDLSYNEISVLHLDTFNPSRILQRLDLSNNKFVSTEPGLYRKLSSLQTLNLNDNLIKTLKVHSFSGLNNIYNINLLGNHIQYVLPGAFLGMGSPLYFSSMLTDIVETETLETDAYLGLSGLGYLDFSNKNIININSRAFRGPTHLTYLSLFNCNISTLPSNAFDGPRITDLNLADNKLTAIVSDIFEGSTIQYLNLTGNQLKILTFDTFAPINDLEKLYLNNASIQIVSNSGYYGIKNYLRLIDLRDNLISSLQSNLFQNMSYLEEIYLSGNPIKTIPSYTFNIQKDLQILTLSVDNFNLNKEVFSGLKKINTIKIQNSIINQIDSNTFSELYVSVININMNKINQIEVQAFNNEFDLRELDLSNNNLKEIKYEIFKNSPNLQTLDLSKNELKTLPCFTSSNLSYLENLHLSNNMINKLNLCTFKPMVNLKYLDLSFNHLTEISDVGTFSSFNLDSLNISHNTLERISNSELYHIRKTYSLDLSYNNINMNYTAFEVGQWREIDIRHNSWECSNLLKLLKTLQSKQKPPQIFSESTEERNIGGITCN